MNAQKLMSMADALQKILADVPGANASSTEQLKLSQLQHRTTAEDLLAPLNIPPFAASAMDGYAVNTFDPVFAHSGNIVLPLQGVSFAGKPFEETLLPGHCIRIMTGACLPPGADSVVIQENVLAKNAEIEIQQKPEPGQHVREIGQDVHHHQLMFESGTYLNPLQLGWLASCGITQLTVHRKIKVAVFATGDELREGGDPLKPGQIYEANRLVLKELCRNLPVEVIDLGIIPDNEQLLTQTLSRISDDVDVILSSGGVSVGDADYVKNVVSNIGQLTLWKIAIKPGKPVAFGRIRNCIFFGLPGNPVSAVITFLLLVKPALQKMCGFSNPDEVLRVSAILQTPIKHSRGRAEYQRAHYYSHHKELRVSVLEDQSSNRFASFRNCNCLLEIPADCGSPMAGDVLNVLPLAGLLS